MRSNDLNVFLKHTSTLLGFNEDLSVAEASSVFVTLSFAITCTL